MQINLTPFIILWVLLAVTVLVLIFWRKSVSSHEDDSLHVLQGSVAQQVNLATKLETIDKWGKILTVIAVIYGVILGAAWIYQSYITASTSSGV
jgi:uncharacterized membrane protein